MNIDLIKNLNSKITLGLVLLTFMTNANSDTDGLAERPFGEVRTRFNMLDSERTPITSRPIRTISKNAFLPPRTRRQGFIPRLTILEEYNDNILFDSENVINDFITRISPGFNFVQFTERVNFELDYSFESTIYPDNSNLNDAFEAHNFFTSGSFRPTKTTTVFFYDTFFSFEDSARQIIPGLSPRNRTNENYFTLQLVQELQPKTELNLIYNQILNQYDDENTATSLTHEGRVSFTNQFSNQDKLGIHYTYRLINFESADENQIIDDDDDDPISTSGSDSRQDAMIHIASVSNIHEFSETLILSSEFGVAFTTEPNSNTNFVTNISLKAPIKNAITALSYNRDIKTAGGFGSLLEIDTVSATIGGFIVNDWYGNLGVDFSRFKQLNGEGIEFTVLEPAVSLEYRFSKQLQFRLGYNYLFQEVSTEDSGTNETDSNRINLGVIANF